MGWDVFGEWKQGRKEGRQEGIPSFEGLLLVDDGNPAWRCISKPYKSYAAMVYIYIYNYIYTYVCMYVRMYVCIYVCMYVCMYVCIKVM